MSERQIDLGQVAGALMRLDDALCNYINARCDPFGPEADWEAETRKNLKRLAEAYNHCHRVGALELGKTPPFFKLSIPTPAKKEAK